jgi:hypothetical protein
MGLFVSDSKTRINITDSPLIKVKARLKKIEISGKSRMNDPAKYYNDLLKDLESYFSSFKKTLIIEFRFEYINTGSSKWIYHILCQMQNLTSNGGMIEIYWYYEEDDEIIFEAGEVLQSVLHIPFHICEY